MENSTVLTCFSNHKSSILIIILEQDGWIIFKIDLLMEII
jgi:hypothetical protein